MFHSCWTGRTAHPLLQNTACISKFKQRFTALLICTAKPETQEGTMQSAEQQVSATYRAAQKPAQPAETWVRQLHTARPGRPQVTKGVLPQKHAVPSPVLQLTPELLSHHCFGHAVTHTVPVFGLFNSILNLLKAPIVYLNKAATGFCTVIAKSKFLVTHYMAISF